MSHAKHFSVCSITLAVLLVGSACQSNQLYAQAGLRESLEQLDINGDGRIEPREITPLARPYLERICRERRIGLNEPVEIDRLQEAARVYYALKNGVAGNNVRPQSRARSSRLVLIPIGPSFRNSDSPRFDIPIQAKISTRPTARCVGMTATRTASLILPKRHVQSGLIETRSTMTSIMMVDSVAWNLCNATRDGVYFPMTQRSLSRSHVELVVRFKRPGRIVLSSVLRRLTELPAVITT